MIIFQKEHSNKSEYYQAWICNDLNCNSHLHTSLELVYVIEGELDIFIDSEKFIMKKGDYALVLPNQAHYYCTENYSRVYTLIFSPDIVNTFSKVALNKGVIDPVFVLDNQTVLQDLILYKRNDILLLKSYLYYICSQFVKKTVWKERPSGKHELQNKLIDYVQSNFSKPLSLKQVADELGYNYCYLSRFFSENFQDNFRNFLNQHRIYHAQYLLRESDMNITSIALACGFENIRSFNRAFSQIVKSTPSEYRSNGSDDKVLLT